jgi:hypothetical protein
MFPIRSITPLLLCALAAFSLPVNVVFSPVH